MQIPCCMLSCFYIEVWSIVLQCTLSFPSYWACSNVSVHYLCETSKLTKSNYNHLDYYQNILPWPRKWAPSTVWIGHPSQLSYTDNFCVAFAQSRDFHSSEGLSVILKLTSLRQPEKPCRTSWASPGETDKNKYHNCHLESFHSILPNCLKINFEFKLSVAIAIWCLSYKWPEVTAYQCLNMRMMANFMKTVSRSDCSENTPQPGDFKMFISFPKLHLRTIENSCVIQGCSTNLPYRKKWR